MRSHERRDYFWRPVFFSAGFLVAMVCNAIPYDSFGHYFRHKSYLPFSCTSGIGRGLI